MNHVVLPTEFRPSRKHAQALIEFAFIAPVMLIMLLGMIDLGRAFVFGVSVQDGAREAARLGERGATDVGVNDSSVLRRLLTASNPALTNCVPPAVGTHAPNTLVCGGESWTFSINITTPNGTTYTSIYDAQGDSNFPASKLTVTMRGSGVSMFAGFQNGWGQSLSPISVRGQAVMVVL